MAKPKRKIENIRSKKSNTIYKIIPRDPNDFPKGYRYNVQLWYNNVYAGNGRFCKTKVEVKQYIKKMENIKGVK